jgi:hypothetical protein
MLPLVAARVVRAYNALGGLAAITNDDTLMEQASKVLYGVSLNAGAGSDGATPDERAHHRRKRVGPRALGICFAEISAVITILVIFVYRL